MALSDFVSGPELGEALKDPNSALTGENVFRILTDLLDAVAYLNRRGLYHCDIKLTNIKLRETETDQAPDVVLLDWGTAQVLKDPTPLKGQQQLPLTLKRRFISTKGIVHPLHQHF